MSNANTFILSWDCHGLESVVNATELEQERVMNILSDRQSGRNNDVGQILTTLTLRARFNTQRHYEIYAIDAVDGISESDIKTAFEDNPQGMADLVRKQGRKLYSDRVESSKIKII